MKYTVYTQSGLDLVFIKSEKGTFTIRSFFRPMSSDVVDRCDWSELELSDKKKFESVLYRRRQSISKKHYELAKNWFKYY